MQSELHGLTAASTFLQNRTGHSPLTGAVAALSSPLWYCQHRSGAPSCPIQQRVLISLQELSHNTPAHVAATGRGEASSGPSNKAPLPSAGTHRPRITKQGGSRRGRTGPEQQLPCRRVARCPRGRPWGWQAPLGWREGRIGKCVWEGVCGGGVKSRLPPPPRPAGPPAGARPRPPSARR